jgi:hypothetical protein
MFHHDPSAVTEGGTEIIAALHLANGVVGAAVAGRDPLTAGALDSAYLDKLGLLSTVPRWHEKALDLLGPLAGAGAK